jgi:hypothetical protein
VLDTKFPGLTNQLEELLADLLVIKSTITKKAA